MDQTNIALACMFYGFVVSVIGIVAFIVPRKVSNRRLRESLWLLGTFGLLHGIRAWIEVLELIAPASTSEQSMFLLGFVSFGLNVMALLAISQFAAEIVTMLKRGVEWLRWVPLTGLALWVGVVLIPYSLRHLDVVKHAAYLF